MVAIEGGEAAGEARLAVEKRTGKPVITNKNAVHVIWTAKTNFNFTTQHQASCCIRGTA